MLNTFIPAFQTYQGRSLEVFVFYLRRNGTQQALNYSVFQFLPVGKELVACLSAFKDLGSTSEGRSGLLSIFLHVQSYNEESEHETRQLNGKFDLTELKKSSPLLSCLKTLLNSIELEDVPLVSTIEAVGALTSGALSFCTDKNRSV